MRAMKQREIQKKEICLRASYTVEAALLLPLFLFAVMKGLLLGIDCYEDVGTAAENIELLETIEPADWIWKMQLAQKGVDLIHEHTVSEKSEEQLYGGD